ncbi:MAG: molybdenum cofactor biosynthesis protein MoaE [Planctomycetaceae bacterium]|nr:molybdenum cofactor biosynthesis protein MoaE [Planctomycetaceae bacterium]
MPHLIELTDGPIDCSQVLSSVQTTQAGAVVLFLGTVREFTQGRQTTHLHYDAYRPMAETKLAELANEASQRWPILNAAIVHRLGHMDLGDVSVAVAVSSPHRPDAFEAGRYLIDRLKEVVPIWKQEHWSDGAVEWVHPAPDTPPS